jgi:hypothetical protein
LAIKRCENKQKHALPGQHFDSLLPLRLPPSKQSVEKMLSPWTARLLLAACVLLSVCADFTQATHHATKKGHHDDDLVTPAPQLSPLLKLAKMKLSAYPSQYMKDK